VRNRLLVKTLNLRHLYVRLIIAVYMPLLISAPLSERGIPMDRTFEIVHLVTGKVVGVSPSNPEVVELQHPGRLLPHQRWVYDKDHGIWNPASGKALLMFQYDASLVLQEAEDTAPTIAAA
jgi:hypothetical protein